MITLQTGLPGACKTLYTLDRVEKIRRKTGRPVFYNGIPVVKEKLPDWQELPNPEDWYKCPPEAIVILDEAQRLFRPRPSSSAVPEYESALETHRHGGIDLICLTQRPRLVCLNLRELVGCHYHAHRTFGLERSKIYRWSECHMNTQSRHDADESFTYRFNKEVFTWYKSAEAHTMESSVPVKVWVLLALLVLIPVLVGWVYMRLQNKMTGADGQPGQQTFAVAGRDSVPGRSASGRVMSQSEFLAQHVPRVPGLAYTAQVYDRVTEPTKAPYPAACAATEKRCECFSQQATKLDMPDQLCRSIVKDGFFMAWDEDKGRGDRPGRVSPVAPARERDEVQAGAGLGGFNTTRVASAEPVSTVKPPEAPQTGQKGRALAP